MQRERPLQGTVLRRPPVREERRGERQQPDDDRLRKAPAPAGVRVPRPGKFQREAQVAQESRLPFQDKAEAGSSGAGMHQLQTPARLPRQTMAESQPDPGATRFTGDAGLEQPRPHVLR